MARPVWTGTWTGTSYRMRAWARAGNPTTTYGYDPATGELLSVTYTNDGDVTPDLGFTYNRLGQKKTVTDAVGTRTFAYRP